MKWQGSMHKQKGRLRISLENAALVLLIAVLAAGFVDLVAMYGRLRG